MAEGNYVVNIDIGYSHRKNACIHVAIITSVTPVEIYHFFKDITAKNGMNGLMDQHSSTISTSFLNFQNSFTRKPCE